MQSITPSRCSASRHCKAQFKRLQVNATMRRSLIAMASAVAQEHLTMHEIQAVPITPDNFASFGQFVEPIDDMKAFDQDDAQLQLDKELIASIARLRKPHFEFTMDERFRYMAVAQPGIKDLKPEDISVFKVPFGTFIKMNPGTWHAGPHFDNLEHMDFYNLELADTNQVDHYNFHFDDSLQAAIKIMPC